MLPYRDRQKWPRKIVGFSENGCGHWSFFAPVGIGRIPLAAEVGDDLRRIERKPEARSVRHDIFLHIVEFACRVLCSEA
jgi:hypothetical protein